MKSPHTRCLIGSYQIDPAVFVWKDENTAHLNNPRHEGAQFKFPKGVPKWGDLVMATSTLDTCWFRGDGNHRPIVKRVVRIRTIDNRHPDKEIFPLGVVLHGNRPNRGEYVLDSQFAIRLKFPDHNPVTGNPPIAADWRFLADKTEEILEDLPEVPSKSQEILSDD